MDDFELLQAYVQQRTEGAFEALVGRHLNLVYSAALRQMREPYAAEEVTQIVFIILARKAATIRRGTILPGWLLRATRYTVLDARRRERRRRNMERKAMMEHLQPTPTEAAWEQVAPLLDEALARLRAKDHDAIVLRFFEQKSFKQIGGALGLSENSARMRVARALERLRGFFARRGVALSAVTVGAALSAHAVQAAPPGLVASVTGATMAQGAGAAASTLALAKLTLDLLTWSKAKALAAIGLAALLLAGTATQVAPALRERFAAPNLIRNGAFAERLEHWYGHVDRSARATFAAEPAPGAKGLTAKIAVTQAGYYDCIELGQVGIPVQAGHQYAVSFRARSTVAQALRVKIIGTPSPWRFYGFRAITEITPRWQTYRLTGHALVTANDGKLMFQCGGAVGDIWIDEVKFQDCGRRF